MVQNTKQHIVQETVDSKRVVSIGWILLRKGYKCRGWTYQAISAGVVSVKRHIMR
jgi:hypothetical protein